MGAEVGRSGEGVGVKIKVGLGVIVGVMVIGISDMGVTVCRIIFSCWIIMGVEGGLEGVLVVFFCDKLFRLISITVIRTGTDRTALKNSTCCFLFGNSWYQMRILSNILI